MTRPPSNPAPVSSHSLKFAPYYDVTLKDTPSLEEIYAKTGQKDFTLAFALGGFSGCEPKWGGEHDLETPRIIDPIRALQAKGGEFIIATGGAVGPYLEHLCTSVDSLAAGYKKILDVVGARHLDIDVEAPINNDIVTKALAQVQRERPDVTVAFTMPVQGDDYGLTDALGTAVLRAAKKNGVRVDIVNPMAMEYPTQKPDWGDSVIATGSAVLGQMKEIWPEKSDMELKRMLGITPMIGRNFNGKMFQVAHARKLVQWANENHIGLLAFWSAGRDNGKCPGGGISPYCSSVSQSEYEFIKTFQGFKG
ncbi:unnamed protein product [Allacma fusca]|uniref:Chitinase n=1 Tax=Allacma fusca TaxID=39272 RepID=A0A8J2LJ32_9HEXA|nr:unnamed protein product [Allacma fusca]